MLFSGFAMNGIQFSITKSFGCLHLVPTNMGLILHYIPNINPEEEILSNDGICKVLVPLEAIGGLWATTKAFLFGVESLDENIIIRNSYGDTLIKLYRDKPKGVQGKLSGEELTWLRIVSGRREEQRRRIKLGQKDLLSIELACKAVLSLSNSNFYSKDLLKDGNTEIGQVITDPSITDNLLNL